MDGDVHDDGVHLVGLFFTGAATVTSATVTLADVPDGQVAGARLASLLGPAPMSHVLLFAAGRHVNGSELVEGIRASLPAGVGITGGSRRTAHGSGGR